MGGEGSIPGAIGDTIFLCQYFPATRVTAYMSSPASTQAFYQHTTVVALSVVDARLLPCYHVNGYTPDEMHQYVEQRAMSWTLSDHAHPFPPVSRFNTLRVYARLAGCLPIRLIAERETSGVLRKEMEKLTDEQLVQDEVFFEISEEFANLHEKNILTVLINKC